MAEKVSREDYISALRAYLDARSAVNAFFGEHVAWFWPESEEPPPEPKPWTQEALEELETLEAREQEALQKWDRTRRAFGAQP